jgi:hypothetical protein
MELYWEMLRAQLFEYWIKQNLDVKEVATLIALKGLKVSWVIPLFLSFFFSFFFELNFLSPNNLRLTADSHRSRHETLEEKFASPEWPEFKKNDRRSPPVGGQAPRRRKVKAPPSKRASLSDYTTITKNARFSLCNQSVAVEKREDPQLCPSPGYGATPGRDLNLQVDRMVVSIRRLVTGLFALDRRHRYPPYDPSSMSSWQLVYDKCVGLDSIGRMHMTRPQKVLFLWDRALGQLQTAAQQARNAAFLVHLWGICGRLLGIRLFVRLRSNPSAILRIFLCRLRQRLIATAGPTDELVVMIESILYVLVSAPLQLKKLLALGSMETASALDRTVGGKHTLVLKTLSSHYQYFWKPGSPVDGEQLKQHKHRVERIDFESPTQDDVEALYSYTITQRHIDPRKASQLAVLLFRLSLRQCQAGASLGKLRYGPVPRALQYSAELLAICHVDAVSICGKPHDVNKRNHAFECVREAIGLLQDGDLECRVQAARLSQRLVIWYKTYFSNLGPGGIKKDPYRERSQKRHTREILARIDELQIPNQEKSMKKCYCISGKVRKLRRKAAMESILQEGGEELRNFKVYVKSDPRHKERKPKMGPAQPPPENPDRTCSHCGETFPSRRAMFHYHINRTCFDCGEGFASRELKEKHLADGCPAMIESVKGEAGEGSRGGPPNEIVEG